MSVAIPIPLLQHLPDVNVTPAVGVDEYALVYDHATGKFVLNKSSGVFGVAGSDTIISLASKDAVMNVKLYTASEMFYGAQDNIFGLVYNWGGPTTVQNADHPRWGFVFEHNYKTGVSGPIWDEFYLTWDDVTANPDVSFRPFMTIVNRATQTISHGLNGLVTFSKSDGTDSVAQIDAATGLVRVLSGKRVVLEGTAALDIGGAAGSGQNVTITQSGDGRGLTIFRATTNGGFYSDTNQVQVGTFSNHPLAFATNSITRATFEASGDLSVNVPVYHNSYPIHVRNSGLYGTLGDAISFSYPGVITNRSWIKHSMADGGAGNDYKNILGFYLNDGSNSSNPVLHLTGDKRAMIATVASAPTDANLFAGSVSFYLDESAHKLMVRVKYANGTTLKTGELSLI